MTADTKTPATVRGAGAWKSPAWYGAGMPMPDTVEGRRRAHLAWPGWSDAGLTCRDRRFLEGNGWRTAWLWNETHVTETERTA